MAYTLYDRFLSDILKGVHNWTDAGSTFKIAIIKPTYTPDASHQFMSDITNSGGTTNYEYNAGAGNTNGYESGFSGSGRQTLASASRTVSIDSTNHRAWLQYGATVSWGSGGTGGPNAGTAGGYVIYRHRTSDADSELVCFLDPADELMNGTEFDASFDPQGIFYL